MKKLVLLLVIFLILCISSKVQCDGNASSYHSEGLKRFDKKQYQEAIKAWLKELAMTPDNPNTMRNIGVAYGSLGNYKAAKQWYYKALQVSPNNAAVHNSLGLVFLWEKNYIECEKEFKKVISLSSSFPYVHFNLGNCYFSQQKYNFAKEEFLQDLKFHPDDVNAIVNLFAIVDVFSASKKYSAAQQVLLELFKIPLKLSESDKRIYDFNKKLSATYQIALIRQDYQQVAKGIKQLMPLLTLNHNLWVPLNRMLAYCYLAVGDKSNSTKVMKQLIKSNKLSREDTVALKSFLIELTAPEKENILLEHHSKKIMIKEYDLDVPSRIDIVEFYDDGGFNKGSFLHKKTLNSRLWMEEEDPRVSHIADINSKISYLGFRLYNNAALKDSNKYFSYDYDLFKNGKLIIPNLAFPRVSINGKRFIMDAEQKNDPNMSPKRVLIDTGKIVKTILTSAYFPILLNDRIIYVKGMKSSKPEQRRYAVMDGVKMLYEFYLDNPVVEPVSSFYSDGEHWILEHYPNKVVIDGFELNKAKNYVDIFNYRYIDGNIFFIFTDSSAKYKMHYDGSELPVEYDQIMNNNCCSASAYNPRNYDDMVSFFAKKDNKWYYVEAVLSEK